jgi:hypothetical protein
MIIDGRPPAEQNRKRKKNKNYLSIKILPNLDRTFFQLLKDTSMFHK